MIYILVTITKRQLNYRWYQILRIVTCTDKVLVPGLDDTPVRWLPVDWVPPDPGPKSYIAMGRRKVGPGRNCSKCSFIKF